MTTLLFWRTSRTPPVTLNFKSAEARLSRVKFPKITTGCYNVVMLHEQIKEKIKAKIIFNKSCFA